jgi:hypothetical protein
MVANKTAARDSAQSQCELQAARVKGALQSEEAAVSKLTHQTAICEGVERDLGDALGCVESPGRSRTLLKLLTDAHVELSTKVHCEAEVTVAKAEVVESVAREHAGTMVLSSAAAGLARSEAKYTKLADRHDAAVLECLTPMQTPLPAAGAAITTTKLDASDNNCRLHHPFKVELVAFKWHFECTCQSAPRYLPLHAASQFLPPVGCQQCTFQTQWYAGENRQIKAHEEMEMHVIACHSLNHPVTCNQTYYRELGYVDPVPKSTCDGDELFVGISLKCVNIPKILMYSPTVSTTIELCEDCASTEADLCHTMMVSDAVDDHKDGRGRWVPAGSLARPEKGPVKRRAKRSRGLPN